MRAVSDDTAGSRPRRWSLILMFLEAAIGLLVVFALAVIAGPRLFNIHNNLTVVAAVVVWLACPVLLFLLILDLAARWRKLDGEPLS